MKEIQLTQGKVALVDDEDFEYLNQWKWYARKSTGDSFQAVRNIRLGVGRRRTLKMERVITNTPDEMVCDHINHNPLDNRKSNLRICTFSQNAKNKKISKNNKTGYKGVSIEGSKFRASFGGNYLGMFITPEDAARAYDKEARKKLGDYANPNFP